MKIKGWGRRSNQWGQVLGRKKQDVSGMAKKKDKTVEVHSVHRPPAWRNWQWKYFPHAHQAPLAILIRPYYHVAGSQREHMLIDLTINSTGALHPSFFSPFLFPITTTNEGTVIGQNLKASPCPKKRTLKPEPQTVRVMRSASVPYQCHHFIVDWVVQSNTGMNGIGPGLITWAQRQIGCG